MAAFNLEEQKAYEDSFGEIHIADFSSKMMAGGQGVVIRTTAPDLALKIIRDENDNVLTDDTQNEKYLDLRILPIPEGLNITLPQATLKGVEGYVMTLLNSMVSFEDAFALDKFFYESALEDKNAAQNDALLIYLEKNLSGSKKRCQKIYAYMKTGGLRRRLMAYMKVAAVLARLHTAGLVYCDFSHKNAFISKDLNYENVWLIDADNLSFAELLRGGFFTPGFGAPEVVARKAGSSFYSDCFSFATALFWHILNRHPFDGAAYQKTLDTQTSEDYADNLRDLGQFAWILDEEDTSNDGRKYLIIPNEILLSAGLRELFAQIFSVDSCENPTHRPTMIQWAYETAFAFDNVIFSKNCGMDYAADGENFFICPVDNLKVPAIRLKSYILGDNDEKISALWQFTHELYNQKIKVPLRILNGFICREIEDFAFVLELQGNKLLIQPDALNFSFSYTDGRAGLGTQFRNFGSFYAAQKNFSIKCLHKNGRRVLIEGERID